MPLEEYNYNEVESGRVETLVQAIEKIEVLERKLEIAMRCLKLYGDHEEWIGPDNGSADMFLAYGAEGGWEPAERALREIEEVK